jgi:hypothetical protein
VLRKHSSVHYALAAYNKALPMQKIYPQLAAQILHSLDDVQSQMGYCNKACKQQAYKHLKTSISIILFCFDKKQAISLQFKLTAL